MPANTLPGFSPATQAMLKESGLVVGNPGEPFKTSADLEHAVFKTAPGARRKFVGMQEVFSADGAVVGMWDHIQHTGRQYGQVAPTPAARLGGGALGVNLTEAANLHHTDRAAWHDAEALRIDAEIQGMCSQEPSADLEVAKQRLKHAAKKHREAAVLYKQGKGGEARTLGKSARLNADLAEAWLRTT